MDKELVPELRFEGFTEPWEEKKLGETTTIQSGARVHKNEWRPSGVPFYRSSDVMASHNGSANIKAYIDKELYESLISRTGKPNKGDVMVTGGGSVGTPYIVPNDDPLYTKDADLIWIRRSDSFDSNYLYHFFLSPIFRRYIKEISHIGTIAHYTIEQVRETSPCFPKALLEQKEIGDILSNLDSLIAKQEKKCAALSAVKSSMLDKMFPKEGETEPELRFDGFSGPWEWVKLGELYRSVNEKNDLSFGRDKIISVANMHFNTNVNVTEDSYLLTYNVMRLGDIAFEGNHNNQFSHGRFVENYIGDGIVSHIFKVLRPARNDHSLLYWKYAINNERTMGPILTKSTKSSTMMHELVVADFLSESILVPPYEEQVLIGEALEELMVNLSNEREKLDLIKQLKGAMLDKMFPKGAR